MNWQACVHVMSRMVSSSFVRTDASTFKLKDRLDHFSCEPFVFILGVKSLNPGLRFASLNIIT